RGRGVRGVPRGPAAPRGPKQDPARAGGRRAHHPGTDRPVQQLQFFLTESAGDAEQVTRRQIALLRAEPLTTPHGDGVLVIDETGVRKDGTHTAQVGHQYLGTIGKMANGIVAVTSLWADQRVYSPLHVPPYPPALRLAGGKQPPPFRPKPQRAWELVHAARAAGIPFRAVVADSHDA